MNGKVDCKVAALVGYSARQLAGPEFVDDAECRTDVLHLSSEPKETAPPHPQSLSKSLIDFWSA